MRWRREKWFEYGGGTEPLRRRERRQREGLIDASLDMRPVPGETRTDFTVWTCGTGLSVVSISWGPTGTTSLAIAGSAPSGDVVQVASAAWSPQTAEYSARQHYRSSYAEELLGCHLGAPIRSVERLAIGGGESVDVEFLGWPQGFIAWGQARDSAVWVVSTSPRLDELKLRALHPDEIAALDLTGSP